MSSLQTVGVATQPHLTIVYSRLARRPFIERNNPQAPPSNSRSNSPPSPLALLSSTLYLHHVSPPCMFYNSSSPPSLPDDNFMILKQELYKCWHSMAPVDIGPTQPSNSFKYVIKTIILVILLNDDHE